MKLTTRKFSRELAHSILQFPLLTRPRGIDNRRSILRLILMGAIFVATLGFNGQAHAAVISPDPDTSGLFQVMAVREITTGTDPRSDAVVAVQSSYFEYRESNVVPRPETLFAPEMPQVGPRQQFRLDAEETVSFISRRY